MSARQISAIAVVIAAAAGGWLANEVFSGSFERRATEGTASDRGSGPCAAGAAPLYWKAPMDPTYVREAPGKSPMGMDLVPVCADEAGATADGEVRIAPALVQSMGVRTARVERRDLARTIRAVGRVDYDERRVAHVHTKIQGWIEKLSVDYEGQMVERGEPLLEIYSPELVATQEELLVAARYRDETAKSPFEDVRESGVHLIEATRRRLELWDIAERDIDRLLESGAIRKNLTLYSPARGVVTHLRVREGMEVGPNQNLYTIADLSRVWVYADVYEYELPWVAVGQKCVVELSYLPGAEFESVVSYVYPFLDPKTRTARLRIEIDNPENVLKPDMFANVRIETQARRDVLVVPDEAVLRSGRRSLVIVALGDGRFAPREVTPGLESGDGLLEVRAGLRESEEIVTSGQFLIDSESRLREAVQKLLEPGVSEEAAAGPVGQEHAGHEMPGAEHMSDHAGHAPPDAEAMPDHSGHSMPDAEAMPDHSGHSMPDAGLAPDHSGHAMPGMEE
jgi:Cu(I)/Ag(I) efflux system membrane fusion protein/cobalt-zinc-cadmium efflux system membrane fusion protein